MKTYEELIAEGKKSSKTQSRYVYEYFMNGRVDVDLINKAAEYRAEVERLKAWKSEVLELMKFSGALELLEAINRAQRAKTNSLQ